MRTWARNIVEFNQTRNSQLSSFLGIIFMFHQAIESDKQFYMSTNSNDFVRDPTSRRRGRSTLRWEIVRKEKAELNCRGWQQTGEKLSMWSLILLE